MLKSYVVCAGDAGMFAINSSSGELYVDDVVDREHASLRPTRGVLQIIVKVGHSTVYCTV